MSAPAYMPTYWGDYFAETAHLSCEQHGAYLQLLGRMWQAGGSLPTDPRALARMTGCNLSRWTKIADDVLTFFVIVDGRLTHKRVVAELKIAQEIAFKRAEAGSRGGRAKSLKDKKADVANAIAPPLAPPQHPLPEPFIEAADDTRGTDVDDWPDGKSIDHARMLCDAVSNGGTLDTAREPGLIQTLGLLHRWRTRGALWDADVLPVVMAMCGKRAGQGPVKTWAYFDQAVAEATKARLAPLKEGTTNGNANHDGRSGRQSDIDAMLEGARQAVDRRHAELSGCS